jgi:hypothetical protein
VHRPVTTARPDERVVAASLDDLAVLKHHDLVHLIEHVEVVRDQQGGTADRRTGEVEVLQFVAAVPRCLKQRGQERQANRGGDEQEILTPTRALMRVTRCG